MNIEGTPFAIDSHTSKGFSTGCFTIALCTFSKDDEAHLTIRDLTAEMIW
jgi:hypothetical protein